MKFIIFICAVLLCSVHLAENKKRKLRVKYDAEYDKRISIGQSGEAGGSGQVGVQSQVGPSPHIVNGDPAGQGDYPYYVIFTIRYGRSYYFSCGGSLINADWVLTAAHCADGYTSNRRRRRIGLFFGASTFSNPTQFRRVSEVIIHPEWDLSTINNDMALLRLDSSVDLTDPNVGTVALPSGSDLYEDENSRITGFGDTSYGGSLPSVLQTVVVPVVPNDECDEAIQALANAPPITDAMICAGNSQDESGSCHGDSGGPMVEEATGELIGVVSWGVGCQYQGLPGVYARVTHFRAWITQESGV